MEINEHNWFIFGQYYLQATVGELLTGTIHNINNCLHVLDMQIEMLNNKLDSMQAGNLQGLEKRINRLTQAGEEISSLVQETGKRQFYLQTDLAQIDITKFLDWQQIFWNNNLFFKHHISFSQEIEPGSPSSLQLPPFLLTLCLEQAFKNALEACTISNDDNLKIKICITPYQSGVHIELFSPTSLPRNKEGQPFDPWKQGSSSKSGHLGLGLPLIKFCAQAAGWKCALVDQNQTTKFTLSIPSLKTGNIPNLRLK